MSNPEDQKNEIAHNKKQPMRSYVEDFAMGAVSNDTPPAAHPQSDAAIGLPDPFLN